MPVALCVQLTSVLAMVVNNVTSHLKSKRHQDMSKAVLPTTPVTPLSNVLKVIK